MGDFDGLPFRRRKEETTQPVITGDFADLPFTRSGRDSPVEIIEPAPGFIPQEPLPGEWGRMQELGFPFLKGKPQEFNLAAPPQGFDIPTDKQMERLTGIYGENEDALYDAARFVAKILDIPYAQAASHIPVMAEEAGIDAVKFGEGMKNAWHDGLIDYDIGMIGWKMLGDIVAGESFPYDVVKTRIDELRSMQSGMDLEIMPFVQRALTKAARTLPLQAKTELQAAPYGLAGAAGAVGTMAVVGNLSPLVVFPEEIVTMPAAAVAAYFMTRKTAKTVALTQQMTGRFLIDLLEKGADPRAAVAIALPIGLGMGLIEMAQFDRLANLVPGKAKGLGKIFQNSLAKMMGSNSPLTTAAKTVGRMGGTYLHEIGEEEVQQVLDIFGRIVNDEIQTYLEDNQGEDVAPTVKAAFQELLAVGKDSAEAMLPLVMIPGITGGVVQQISKTAETTIEPEINPNETIVRTPEGDIEVTLPGAEIEKVPEPKQVEKPVGPVDFERTVEPTGETISDKDYVYHATNLYNAQDIAESGILELHAPDFGTEQDVWPDGAIEERAYFSERADVVWQFAPEDGKPVILRVKKDTGEFKKESTGDIYTIQSVPASAIEILTEDGWVSLVTSEPIEPEIQATIEEDASLLGLTKEEFVEYEQEQFKEGELPAVADLEVVWERKAAAEGITAVQPGIGEGEVIESAQDILAETEEQALKEESIEERAHRLIDEQSIEAQGTVKAQVRVATRKPMSALVSEYKALTAVLKREAKATAAGRRLGIAERKVIERRLKENAKARKQVREDIKAIKGLAKGMKTWDPIQKAEGLAVLEGLDLVTRRSAKKLASLQKTAVYLNVHSEEHDLPDYVIEDLQILDKKPLGQLSPNEIHSLRAALSQSEALSKKKHQLQTKRRTTTIKTAGESIRSELPTSKESKGVWRANAKPGGWVKAKRAIQKYDINQLHHVTIPELVFGRGGVGYEVLARDIELGGEGRLAQKQEALGGFHERLAARGFKQRNLSKWIFDTSKVPGIDLPRSEWLERGQRLAIAMHAASENNLASMLKGGIGFSRDPDYRNEVYQITGVQVAAILDGLDADEKAWLETAAELFEAQKIPVGATHIRLNGWELRMEDNYYPKHTMPLGRAAAESIEAETLKEEARRKYFRIGVSKGHVQERVGATGPIYINNIIEDMNESIEWAAAYCNMEEPLRNAGAVLKEVHKDIVALDGGEKIYGTIVQGLRDLSGEHKMYTDVEKGLMKLKSGITKYALMFKPKIAIQQLFSLPFASVYIPGRFLTFGAVKETFSPRKIKQRHMDNDVRFIDRKIGGFNKDIADAVRNYSAEHQVLGTKHLSEIGMGLTRWTDIKAVSSVMQGAVDHMRHALTKGEINSTMKEALLMSDQFVEGVNSGKTVMSEEDMRKLGYDWARYVVSRTQPMFSREYRSAFQSGTPVEQLAAQFTSFTNQAYNLMRLSMNDVKRGNKLDPATYRKITTFAVSFAMNVIGITALTQVRDRLKGRDEEELQSLIPTFVDSVFGMFYGISHIEKTVSNAVRWGMGAGGISVDLPVARFFDTIAKIGINAVQLGDPEKRDNQKYAEAVADGTLDLIYMWRGFPQVVQPFDIKKTIERRKE